MTDLAEVKYLGNRRTQAQWSQLLKGFAGSELNVAQYCAQHGVSVSNFYRWRAVLGEVGVPGSRQTKRKAPASIKEFVDLGPLERAVPNPVADIGVRRIDLRLDLGAGMVLTLSRD